MMHFIKVYKYLTTSNINGNLVVCMAKFQGVTTTPLPIHVTQNMSAIQGLNIIYVMGQFYVLQLL